MALFKKRRPVNYTEISTVESQRNDLTAEEFPEGPYGASIPVEILGKSSPWLVEQRAANPFSYENRELHEGLPRVYPFADPLHSYDFPSEHLTRDEEFVDDEDRT